MVVTTVSADTTVQAPSSLQTSPSKDVAVSLADTTTRKDSDVSKRRSPPEEPARDVALDDETERQTPAADAEESFADTDAVLSEVLSTGRYTEPTSEAPSATSSSARAPKRRASAPLGDDAPSAKTTRLHDTDAPTSANLDLVGDGDVDDDDDRVFLSSDIQEEVEAQPDAFAVLQVTLPNHKRLGRIFDILNKLGISEILIGLCESEGRLYLHCFHASQTEMAVDIRVRGISVFYNRETVRTLKGAAIPKHLRTWKFSPKVLQESLRYLADYTDVNLLVFPATVTGDKESFTLSGSSKRHQGHVADTKLPSLAIEDGDELLTSNKSLSDYPFALIPTSSAELLHFLSTSMNAVRICIKQQRNRPNASIITMSFLLQSEVSKEHTVYTERADGQKLQLVTPRELSNDKLRYSAQRDPTWIPKLDIQVNSKIFSTLGNLPGQQTLYLTDEDLVCVAYKHDDFEMSLYSVPTRPSSE